MNRVVVFLVAALALALALAGCTQAAPAPTPTKPAAAAPTKPAEPTKPAAAATKPAEPTKPAAAATKPAEPTKPAATAAPTAAPAKKVDYPTKGQTISIIVPFSPGGAADLSARMVAADLEKRLGVSVQVVNRAGAATQIGISELVRAKPDGYTLAGVSGSVPIAYLDAERKAGYTKKDIQLIANYAVEPNMIPVKADSPFKTIKDLVDAAKAKPGEIKIGTTGLMGLPDLGIVSLQTAGGVKFARVAFDGAATAATALLGGHVDAICASGVPILPHYKAGAVRVLAILDREGTKFFPDVKTAEEQGYKAYAPGIYGMAAPGGTPKEIVDILTNAIKAGVAADDLKGKLDGAGLTPRYMDPAQYDVFWKDYEDWLRPLLELAKQPQ